MFGLVVSSSLVISTISGQSSYNSRNIVQGISPLPGDVSILDTHRVSRLTVDPVKDATGLETKQAGLVELSKFFGYYLYVPQACVGKVRCPLVLMLHGGGRSGGQEVLKFKSLSDQYGMIMLAGSSNQQGRWDIIGAIMKKTLKYEDIDKSFRVTEFKSTDIPRLDSALKFVLGSYAIDPSRLALVGFSDGGSYSLFLGLNNLHVFSRVAPLSALMPFHLGAKATQSQIFLSGGIVEWKMARQTLERAYKLKSAGHSVRSQIGLRGHSDNVEDENFVWGWLKDSWADPQITRKGFSSKNSYIHITEEAFAKVTKVWSRVLAQPARINIEARMKNQVQIPMLIGSEETTVIMTDMAALASAHPSVAQILKESELSAKQFMDYRIAIIAAVVAQKTGMYASSDTTTVEKSEYFESVDSKSDLGKNIEFFNQHKDLFNKVINSGVIFHQ